MSLLCNGFKMSKRAAGGASYAAEVLADSPVAYWRLGEASGITATDETGSYDGTYQNTPTLGEAGAVAGNTAVSFARASSERVLIGSSAADFAFICTTGIFSIEAWIKLVSPTEDNYSTILGTSPATAERGFFLVWENRTIVGGTKNLRFFSSRAQSGVPIIDSRSADNAITDTDWHHVVATGDGTNCRFYIDGVEETGSGTMGTKSTGGLTRDIAIADAPYLSQLTTFNGTIDEVAVYDYQLTAARIAAHYAASGL